LPPTIHFGESNLAPAREFSVAIGRGGLQLKKDIELDSIGSSNPHTQCKWKLGKVKRGFDIESHGFRNGPREDWLMERGADAFVEARQVKFSICLNVTIQFQCEGDKGSEKPINAGEWAKQ
jgi:hypothetical protein